MSYENVISGKEKIVISFLYNECHKTPGEISKIIGRSKSSVKRYRYYNKNTDRGQITKSTNNHSADEGENPDCCKYCGSTDIKFRGFRQTKQGPHARWKCNSCKRSFVKDKLPKEVQRTKKQSTGGTESNNESQYTGVTDPQVESTDNRMNDDIFLKIYDEFVNGEWFNFDESQVIVFIKNSPHDWIWREIKNWSRFKGMYKIDIIKSLVDLLFTRYQEMS